MELNDIVELRGNYYHLRAINDYNLKNGECNIQLLGPILDDALVFTTTSTTTQPTTTTSTTSTSTTSTSTTTSTTTTTTISPNPCSCMEIIVTSAPAETSWLSCYDGTYNTFYSVNGTYYQCVQKIGGLNQIDFISGGGTIGQVGNCKTQDCPPATTTTTTTEATTTTTTAATTTTTTAAPPSYNYYTLTSCTSGGIGTNYRSILSLGLNSVYSFLEAPPTRACYQITDINAEVNTNDLPTLYGPYLSGCGDTSCQQL
jgi:hypothetical protein